MTDDERGTAALRLGDVFPPIPTEDWEAAILRDLKGADYQKRLVWRTDEGIAVKPYSREEDLAALGPIARAPGEIC